MVVPLEVKQASWQNKIQTRASRLQADLRKAVARARRAASPKRDKSYVPERLKHADRPAAVVDRRLQALLLLCLVVPALVASFFDPSGLALAKTWAISSFAGAPTYLAQRRFWFAVACLCVERVCYTWVWCWPASFKAFLRRAEGTSMNRPGDTPVDVIYKLFKVNKFFQALGFALLYFKPMGPGAAVPQSLFAVVLGLSLGLVGQALNVGIYRAIGKNGVYYGYKFGIEVPWCTGFPFTLGLAHPQYLGSTMTAYGLVLATCTDAHAAAGFGGLAHVQALLYAYMSYVEHNL